MRGSRVPTPLVSIVIPCFARTPRELALLDETLGTVDAQTCRDYEVLVVDDGSPLGAEVEAVASAHPATRVLHRPNGGSAAARNSGIAQSRGRFFVFLDADDHLLPPALDAGLSAFSEHPECGFVLGPRDEMTYEGAPVPWGMPAMPQATDLYITLLGFDWYIIPPSSGMFRREAVERVGGFRDPWGADDLDFYLRVARRYPAWCFDAPAVTRYRRYSTSSSRDGERMLHSIRVVYAREWRFARGNPAAEAAYHRGLSQLVEIFADCLVENVEDRVRAGEWRRAARATALLARESPRRLPTAAARAWAARGSHPPAVSQNA
jgi:glycosyltransferase involved in cell wall biosynthesis